MEQTGFYFISNMRSLLNTWLVCRKLKNWKYWQCMIGLEKAEELEILTLHGWFGESWRKAHISISTNISWWACSRLITRVLFISSILKWNLWMRQTILQESLLLKLHFLKWEFRDNFKVKIFFFQEHYSVLIWTDDNWVTIGVKVGSR